MGIPRAVRTTDGAIFSLALFPYKVHLSPMANAIAEKIGGGVFRFSANDNEHNAILNSLTDLPDVLEKMAGHATYTQNLIRKTEDRLAVLFREVSVTGPGDNLLTVLQSTDAKRVLRNEAMWGAIDAGLRERKTYEGL